MKGEKVHFEKIFDKDDIVYYVASENNRPVVKYGIVFEQFSDAVIVDRLVAKNTKAVNGIPLNEFESETRFHKLPKGWTYDTKLFEITEGQAVANIDITSLEDVKRAYLEGDIIRRSVLDDKVVEVEITKEGYRLVASYPHCKSNSVSLRPDSVYRTFNEAKAEVNRIEEERKRQSELTDKEWSLEQIKHTTERYEKLYGKDGQKYYEWLANMENVEDIETRIYGNALQWKYCNRKRWAEIEVDFIAEVKTDEK